MNAFDSDIYTRITVPKLPATNPRNQIITFRQVGMAMPTKVGSKVMVSILAKSKALPLREQAKRS